MASIYSLKTFLDANPDFGFDVIEYLLSTKYTDYLIQCINEFRYPLFRIDDDPKSKVISAIKDNTLLKVPAYKHLNNTSDFNEIPLVDKQTLLYNSQHYISGDYEISDLFARNTSGTTRKPVTIYYSEKFYFEFLILTTIKISVLANVFHNACNKAFFSITISDNPNLNNRVIVDPTNTVGFMLLVKIDEQKTETIERLFHLITTFKPAILISTPNLFEIIISNLKGKMLLRNYIPLAIFSSGSVLTEDKRQKIQNFFRTKVFNCYNTTEFGFIASECKYQDGMHIDPSLVVELHCTESEERDKKDGDELVISSIRNKAMPLLRFVTGDRVTIDYTTCNCGREGLRIKGISGRDLPIFYLKDGKTFSPYVLVKLFYMFPIEEFQVIQLDYHTFEIFIQLCKGTNTSQNIDTIFKNVENYVRNTIPCDSNIIVKSIEFDYKSNFQRFITRINKSLDEQMTRNLLLL